jgi:tetratricopeptide (TPR) repeat protein
MKLIYCFVSTITIVLTSAAFTGALPPQQVKQIAKAVTIQIESSENKGLGSGIIIKKQGELYTFTTNRHVICGQDICSKAPVNQAYVIITPDGRRHQVRSTVIKILSDELDLALGQFRSASNYPVAKLLNLNSLKIKDQVYIAGFPRNKGDFVFENGQVFAATNKRLAEDSGGYTVIYKANTAPGMSGSGVFNSQGQVVAIHGSGDRYREGTDIDDYSRLDQKSGQSRGIPINWLIQGSKTLGMNLGVDQRVLSQAMAPMTADEFFIMGFNKALEPNPKNIQQDKKKAITLLTNAIDLKPDYDIAYLLRGYIYDQIGNSTKALADYNQTIQINPNNNVSYINRGLLKAFSFNDAQGGLSDLNQAIKLDSSSYAYSNRGLLKADKLNDNQGALADYNEAITINSNSSYAYNNRGLLKADKLNDSQGALIDYNQAIKLNPNFSNIYYNRGLLKADRLNDYQGALADYNQAIKLNPNFALFYNNRGVLKTNKLNDDPGALADYDKAIKLNPNFALFYNNRGFLKADKLNDSLGALADYDKAIKLDPNYAYAYSRSSGG